MFGMADPSAACRARRAGAALGQVLACVGPGRDDLGDHLEVGEAPADWVPGSMGRGAAVLEGTDRLEHGSADRYHGPGAAGQRLLLPILACGARICCGRIVGLKAEAPAVASGMDRH